MRVKLVEIKKGKNSAWILPEYAKDQLVRNNVKHFLSIKPKGKQRQEA